MKEPDSTKAAKPRVWVEKEHPAWVESVGSVNLGDLLYRSPEEAIARLEKAGVWWTTIELDPVPSMERRPRILGVELYTRLDEAAGKEYVAGVSIGHTFDL
jgi:hypothetical protein